MMLQTLVSHSLSKKIALFQQLIGGHGQVVQKLVIVVSRQEPEHVLTIKEVPPMNQKLTKKLAKFKNAVIIGRHGQIAVTVVRAEQELVQADLKMSNKVVWRLPLHRGRHSR